MATATSVEEYLAALSDVQRQALEGLRRTIRATAPDATEAISYQMPAFKDHDRSLVAYAAFKHHCSFFPMSKRVIRELDDELKTFYTSTGTIRFQPYHPLPEALVKKIVTARLEENAAKRRQK
jgi:uncharacterized protein YdhG (YjbR/CyaY superfamily)